MRSSRRLQGLPPQADSLPANAVYLPIEIRAIIVQFLEKKDLKQLRLVSNDWSFLATTLLFDRVFVSPHKKDLQIFNNVTKQPIISAAIKHLVYDPTTFKNSLNYDEYFEALLAHMNWITFHLERYINKPFDCEDAEIHAFFGDYTKAKSPRLSGDSFNYDTLKLLHQGDRFVLEGFQEHKQNAKDELSLANNSLSEALFSGISQLRHLNSVEISTSHWRCEQYNVSPSGSSMLGTRQKGSPLARSWHPFHAKPVDLNLDEDPLLRLYDVFNTLTDILAVANGSIARFQTPIHQLTEGIPSTALKATSQLPLQKLLDAYSSLEHFTVTVVSDEDMIDEAHHLTKLPRLLANMPKLKQLDLDLSHADFGDVRRFCLYEQVFPTDMVWTNLTQLTFWNISFRAMEFITLIFNQQRLRRLGIVDMNLLDGTWEGIIEALHHKLLIWMSFGGNLTFQGNPALGIPTDPIDHLQRDSFKKIQKYVVHGGRHPYLSPDLPPESAIGWYVALLPGERLEKIKLAARQVGLDINRLGVEWLFDPAIGAAVTVLSLPHYIARCWSSQSVTIKLAIVHKYAVYI